MHHAEFDALGADELTPRLQDSVELGGATPRWLTLRGNAREATWQTPGDALRC